MIDDKEIKAMLEEATIDDNEIHMVFDVDVINATIEKTYDETSSGSAPHYNTMEFTFQIDDKGMLTSFSMQADAVQDEQEVVVELTLKMKDVNQLEAIEFPAVKHRTTNWYHSYSDAICWLPMRQDVR